MAIEISNFIPAAAVVTQNGAHVAVTFGWTQGINKPLSTHLAAGQYDIFLDEPIAAAEMGAVISQLDTHVNATFSVESIAAAGSEVEGTHKRIFTKVADTAAASDVVSFYVEFRRVPGYPASFTVPTATL